ncbi:hypothetical protein [Pyxidicoccus caerfyrddinensis]|uniref:hypothetical protein n=1 Tax=Pyxidicoccus caerfyrddinensis TaxID=2709663 RepID=UPI0013D8EB72|nr:hypothetical protein [Pyxidicoccus caerfyrddinensis]
MRWALLFVLMAGSAAAQERRTIEVGQTTCIEVRRAVKSSTVRVEPPEVAQARFDTNLNRLCIDGRHHGEARVTFSGTYRRIVVGSELREEALPFEHSAAVRVLPPSPDVREIPRTYALERGQARRAQLSVFLGPEFSRTAHEDDRWRAVNVEVDRPGIANVRTTVDRHGRLMLEVTGDGGGNVRVKLTGERRVHGDWQQVVRVLNVVVS